jgi:ankyrin repeat protein
MKKGCLLWFVKLAVLVALYYWGLHGRVSPPADRIGALAGGFFLLLTIGSFQNVAIALRNRKRLEAALAGVPFEPGKQVAAIGPIQALGAPVESPFTKTKCVFYSCDISHESRTQQDSTDRDVKDFTSLCLTPCAVYAPGGTVRILGFPVLQGFPELPRREPEVRANAESYLRSTQFEKVGFLQLYSQIKDLLTDQDGYIRKDMRMTDDPDFRIDPAVHTLKEQVVPDGETVCALGYYSAEKDGLIPGFTKGGEGLTLIRGGEEAARKALKGNIWQYVATGIGLLLVSHFFLFLFLFLREPSVRAEKEEVREAALLQAAQNGDATAVQAQLEDGTDANARDSESNTPLMLTRDPEVARRLIASGADVNARNRSGSTPLIEAAKNGAAEVARLLVQAGADLEARDTQANQTALEWAVQSEQEEVVKVLRDAGAKSP